MARTRANLNEIRARCEKFSEFVKEAWPVLEPETDLVWNWHLDAMCLPAESIITTEDGPMPIGVIVRNQWKGRVLSFNAKDGALEWKPILRHFNTPAQHLLAFKTRGGLTFKATDNHPIYVSGRGYVRADKIQPGDRIVNVRELCHDIPQAGERQSEVLFPQLPLQLATSKDRCGKKYSVRSLRKYVSAIASGTRSLLFAKMLRAVSTEDGNGGLPKMRWAQGMGRQSLPDMLGEWQKARQTISVCELPLPGLSNAGPNGAVCSDSGRFLQPELPFYFYDRSEESSLCRWAETFRLSARVQGSEKADIRARSSQVLSLSIGGSSGCPSHQPEQGGRFGWKSGHALSGVSCRTTSATTRAHYRAVGDIVESIGREVQLSGPLFNIEVEANNSYVADGVLMHNCDTLQAISEGKINPRLIINIPPGSSKSMIVSVLWNAWVWGPLGQRGKRFLSTSYEMTNVSRDTRKTRDLVMSEWYRTLWPEVQLKRTGETDFENTQRGSRLGVPFVALMSKRGDVLTIDDPHSLDGAESELQRTNAVRRFIEGGRSRINDRMKSAIVIVMQRLHMDDLTGSVLARNLGYHHIMIPMEFEIERRCIIRNGPPPPEGANDNRPIFWQDPRTVDGELMDPKRVPQAEVDSEKESEYSYAGQYQQRPQPREGGLFKVDKIKIIAASPGGGRLVSGWDLAGTTRKTSAFTARILLRRCTDGQIIIENAKRERKSPLGVKTLALQTTIDDGHAVLQSFPQDPAQAGLAQKLDWAVMLEGHNFRFSPETGDKATRALGIASAIEAGIVSMVKGDWNIPLIEEMRNFPSSKFKDQVDALSRAYTELTKKGDGPGGMGFTVTVDPLKEPDHGELHPDFAYLYEN